MKIEKPKLIPNWRKAWRMLSVQIPAINAAFLGTWAALPDRFQDAYPIQWVVFTALVLLVMGIVGRLIDQPMVKE